MLNNFIYAKQKSLFEEALNSDEVLDEAVVFIADTKEIWNHGTYFDCSTFDPSEIENTLTNKVDKVSGKQLSTEDFTTTLKTRLEGLNIYKKTYRQLQSLPSESQGWYTIAKVDDTESSLFQVSTGGHSDVTFTVSTGWGGNPGGSLTILNSFYSNDTGDINGNHVHIKQVRIRKYNNKLHIDLDLNKPISNASNYVNIVISAFTNAGHDLLENELVLSDSQGTVVQTFELQNQAIMADKVVTKTITADNLATVATSGNYNDLSNKPTIPSAVTQSTVSGWGFTTEQWVNEQYFLKEHQDISNKVDKDDNAPKLTAGFAGNLVGRGEATDEEISFRPSGGETSIEDGTARIERLKGNTVVWNQMLDKTRYALINCTISGNTLTRSGDNWFDIRFINLSNYTLTTNFVDGHEYLLYVQCVTADTGSIKFGVMNMSGVERTGMTKTFTGTGRIVLDVFTGAWTADSNYGGPRLGSSDPNITSITIDNITIYDLTQMFGEGNEPTTIKEFKARKPLGIDEYAYNEGELISTNAEELKSVGFNAWDEEWEVGALVDDGSIDKSQSDRRTTSFIKVKENSAYRFTVPKQLGGRIALYDSDKQLLFYDYNGVTSNGIIATIVNTAYMRYTIPREYGTTYNHDICINLSHTGYRNGEYEPYKEFRRRLPISEIKDSESNQLFPNGLLSAGSVYDEITATKAIKRIGMVDMGTLKWGISTTANSSKLRMQAHINDMAVVQSPSVVGNAICSKFETISANDTYSTVQGIAVEAYQRVSVYDPSNVDSAELFQSEMQGIMLYYELAEPIEVDLPEPLNLDYEVSDFGTEEVISDVPTAPMKADIIYQFNAVDRIRDNSSNIKSLDAKLGDINSILESIING